MIVFKTFVKVLNKCKGPVILFTVMLIFFGALNFNNQEGSLSFVGTKPDIIIVNDDVNEGITKHFIEYLESKSNIIDIQEEDKINDALFYRNVNYVVYIPRGFREDIKTRVKPVIKYKSTGDYNASLASMMVDRYMSVLNVYNEVSESEEKLISLVSKTIEIDAPVEVTSKLDTNSLSKLSTYFNFMNYSILAGLVYAICLILSSFKKETILKRTVISSIKYEKFNRQLILSNGLFAIVLWTLYMILSFILLGDIMFSTHALICVINSFVFLMCALVIAFFIGNLVKNKNAVNGIVNVVALGSSFLCGAFVPVEFMPDAVINLGKILPSYWYINTNDLVKSIEAFNLDNLMPIIKNMGVMVLFIIVFVVLTNVVSYKKRKIA